MGKVRVLIVDDSVVARKLVSMTLEADPDIEVIGTARNGLIGVQKVEQLRPDLVVMDVEMPVMSGLEALKEVRKTHPRLPVIMFSTLTESGASTTLDALSLGASDYATKPSKSGSQQETTERISEDLVPKIKGLCGLSPRDRIGVAGRRHVKTEQEPAPAKRPAVTRRPSVPRTTNRVDVVAIGVSTGGPRALADVIPRLPGDFPVPIVLVQHMPEVFTRLLAERLDSSSQLSVVEAAEGMRITPGGVWIAPGGYHMALQRVGTEVQVHLNQDPPENSCRPAVDVLFRSVAALYGAHTLAAIMTGMGQDGMLGCEAIRDTGGQIIAQDEDSSVVWGMPGAVVDADLADRIVELDQLAAELNQKAQWGRVISGAQGPLDP